MSLNQTMMIKNAIVILDQADMDLGGKRPSMRFEATPVSLARAQSPSLWEKWAWHEPAGRTAVTAVIFIATI
jgi:hypothetical protein